MTNTTTKMTADQALNYVNANNENETPVIALNKDSRNLAPIQLIENYIKQRYELRHNQVSLDFEVREINTSNNFTEFNINNLLLELLKAHFRVNDKLLLILLKGGLAEAFDPFKHYFENLTKWQPGDVDFIGKVCEYVPVTDPDRFKKHFKKMLVRCVACSLGHDFNKQAFILVHKQQNSGKSSFCRWLCPPILEKYITESFTTDKDGELALASNFMINLDEVAAFPQKEINWVKSSMSKDIVKVRPPYGSKAQPFKRRANFIGSTNKSEFLNDETGSVRWLCFEMKDKINFNYRTEIDINSLWAQAYYLYNSKFEYKLTLEEIAENEKINSGYRVTSMEHDIIQKLYTPCKSDEFEAEFCNATDLKLKIEQQNSHLNLNIYKIGTALTGLGFLKGQKLRGKNPTYGYYVKPTGEML